MTDVGRLNRKAGLGKERPAFAQPSPALCHSLERLEVGWEEVTTPVWASSAWVLALSHVITTCVSLNVQRTRNALWRAHSCDVKGALVWRAHWCGTEGDVSWSLVSLSLVLLRHVSLFWGLWCSVNVWTPQRAGHREAELLGLRYCLYFIAEKCGLELESLFSVFHTEMCQ